MKGYGIEVEYTKAQDIIRSLNRLQLLDTTLEFMRTDKYLVIPITREISNTELAKISKNSYSAKVIEATFAPLSRTPKDLRQAIGESIPSSVIKLLPRSYDIVGDIGILELDNKLQAFSHDIAHALMRVNPHLRLVVQKTEKTAGLYRTRGIDIVTGSGTTETVHIEFGARFHLDVASVYFNPRLSYERMRVATQVKGGESVVDLFAGVGPYSILIARRQPSARIFSIDWNPAAYRYLKDNIFANKLAHRVTPILGDSREFALQSPGIADRVIMNLPSDSGAFLGAAATLLRKAGGVVHFYRFASRDEELQDLSEAFRSGMESFGRRVVSISFLRAIKEVGPNRVQVAIDANIL